VFIRNIQTLYSYSLAVKLGGSWQCSQQLATFEKNSTRI